MLRKVQETTKRLSAIAAAFGYLTEVEGKSLLLIIACFSDARVIRLNLDLTQNLLGDKKCYESCKEGNQ